MHPMDTESSQIQWVDYLPQDSFPTNGNGSEPVKRTSLDATETWLTPDNSAKDEDHAMPDDSSMHIEDWDVSSLEEPVLPAAFLLDHDPFIQHELLLDESSQVQDDSCRSLHDMLEERKVQLAASMQRSRESRRYLERHIQQRANLANVLAEIERSSQQVDEHVLMDDLIPNEKDILADEHVLRTTAAMDEDMLTNIEKGF